MKKIYAVLITIIFICLSSCTNLDKEIDDVCKRIALSPESRWYELFDSFIDDVNIDANPEQLEFDLKLEINQLTFDSYLENNLGTRNRPNASTEQVVLLCSDMLLEQY